MSTPHPALTLTGIGFAYRPRGRAEVAALSGIDLTIEAGTTTAIIGPNGCGKTTLLRIACGLLEPDEGTISGPAAALMPQQDLLLPWAGALDNSTLALRAGGADRASARSVAAEWFPRFGLGGFEQARPHELSGGMRQRVAFLRTLLSGKDVLALDEPFAALDALTRLEARDWLTTALRESGRTAIVVTHDIDEAIAIADGIVVLTPRPATVASVHATGGAETGTLREAILESLAVKA